MKRRLHALSSAARYGFYGAGLLVLGTKAAHAYIDPGSGSMILQVLAAGGLAAIFWWRALKARIGEWLRAIFGRTRAKRDDRETPGR